MHHERRPYYTVTAAWLGSGDAADQLSLALLPAAEADIMGFSDVKLRWEPANAVRRRRALSEKARALLLTKVYQNPFDINYNGAGASSRRLDMGLGFYCHDCYMHWEVALHVELAFCLLAPLHYPPNTVLLWMRHDESSIEREESRWKSLGERNRVWLCSSPRLCNDEHCRPCCF